MRTTPKTMIIIALLMLGCSTGLLGQTFEEYKKKRQQELQEFKDERDKQLRNLAKEFDEYVEKQDREYTEYLKERWRQFEVFRGKEPPQEPKPVVAPVFEEEEKPLPPEPMPVIRPALEEPPTITPAPVLPRITKQEPTEFPVSQASLDFYGFPVSFTFDEQMTQVSLNENLNEKSISQAFEALSATNYNALLEQFFDYASLMNLNDWGYYLMVKNATGLLVDLNENSRTLFTWFFMIRSGYKVKLAYFENTAYLLIPAMNQVYGINYFTFNGINYYLMDGDLLNIYTYEKDFPEAQKIFDLNLYEALSLGDEMVTKAISFSWAGEDYIVPVKYSKNVIDFYNDYPLADIKVYFDAVVSVNAKTSLVTAFMPLLNNKSELEAVNLLLHFVQTGFEYETDQEQFGYEKFFFAEEAFHYPYCDCEDRSVLFSYLVKSLLGLEVIGLDYPGHVATAVCFNEDVGGDYFNVDGKKFVMADPTYINAPVGLTMPEYKSEKAEIIMLDQKYFESRQKEFLWDDIIAAGGNRGDNGRDFIMNDDGSGIVTGYFNEKFTYADIAVAGTGKPSMFTLMVDAGKNPVWFESSRGNGLAMAYNLARDANDNVFVAGTFEGKMQLGDRMIETGSGEPDIFLAKFSPEGNLKWLSSAGIDTANKADGLANNYLNFVVKFGKDGKHVANELYFESGDFSNYGISFLPGGEIAFAGAFNKTTGVNLKEVSYAAAGDFNAVEALKSENDRLIQESYEKTIAGLFAVVNLVESSGVSIPGSAAREVLDKYNPQFKIEFPEIYKTIRKIHFIKNEDGIVTVKTDDMKSISIDMMRVNNEARLKISNLESGDARIDILSGVKVGKAIWWYDLNYILMYRKNGDLLFDYDTDHAQAVKNLRIDILY